MFDEAPPLAPAGELPDWLTDGGVPSAPSIDALLAEPPPEPEEFEESAVTEVPAAVEESPRPADGFGSATFALTVLAPPGSPTVTLCGEVVVPDGVAWGEVVVRLPAPPGLKSSGGNGKCRVADGRIEWSLGDLQPGRRVKLKVAVPNAGVGPHYAATCPGFAVAYRLTPTVAPEPTPVAEPVSPTPEAPPAAVPPAVAPPAVAPLRLTASAPESIDLDAAEPFRVNVENPGPAARRDIAVTLSVPAGLRFESSDGVHRPELGRVEWTVRELPPGESRTLTAWLRGDLPGPLALTATADDGTGPVAAGAASDCRIPATTPASSLAAAAAALDLLAADADPESARPARAVGVPHVLFLVGEATYATPLAGLVEVIHPPAVSPVPDAPDWLVGLANVRGEVTSILDFRAVLELPPHPGGRRTVLVARTPDGATVAGLLVDRVVGIRRLHVDPVEVEGDFEWGRVGEFVAGLTEDGDRLVPVLDLARVLTSPSLQAFAAA